MKEYNSQNIIEHPFKLFIEKDSEFLVIGTFPTTKNRISFDFYYPSASNKFWKTLSSVFNESKSKFNLIVSTKDNDNTKLKNKLERQNFCRENKIAIVDIIASCIRMNNNSKDNQLLVHRYSPILEILHSYPSIRKIILTAKSLGSSANHHFYQYLTMNEKDFAFEDNPIIPKGLIELDGRKIEILSLGSTSNRNLHINDDKLLELYKTAFERK